MRQFPILLSFCLITALFPLKLFTQIFTETKLAAGDVAADDIFGHYVSISGDLAIVSSRGDEDNGSLSGSAYIFSKDIGGMNNWGQLKKLTASDASIGDQFGFSLSLSGEVAIISAAYDDDAGNGSGSAYVFNKNEGGLNNWGQLTKLTADDAASGDRFGWSITVSGDVAIVGAPFDDDGGTDSGSAYIFYKDSGGPDNWGQVVKLTADDAAANDQFGYGVSIKGNVAIVSAAYDDQDGIDMGSAYIFYKDSGGVDNWGQVSKLTDEEAFAGSRIGWTASVSEDVAILGTLNGSSAYLFSRDSGGPNNWGLITKLTSDDYEQGDQFGIAVSLSGNVAIVGAIHDKDGGTSSGSAYIFSKDLGGLNNWGQLTKLTATDAAAHDVFGWSVSLSDNVAVVGAAFADDVEIDSGSAYIFEADCDNANSGICCNADITLDGSDLFSDTYQAGNSITIVGCIPATVDVTFDAPTVIFGSSFKITPGAVITTEFVGCN